MARTIYRDDGHGGPVGKVNIEVRVEDANWFRRRARLTQSGKKEPMYSIVWRYIDLFKSEKKELLEIVEESDQKTRTISALYMRIAELEAEVKLVKQHYHPIMMSSVDQR